MTYLNFCHFHVHTEHDQNAVNEGDTWLNFSGTSCAEHPAEGTSMSLPSIVCTSFSSPSAFPFENVRDEGDDCHGAGAVSRRATPTCRRTSTQ
jgi:hypothetical protein